MSRNGAGVYSLPAGSTVANGDTSDQTDVNTPFADIEADLNVARPVVAGGTGATTAADARTNLGLDIGTNVQAYDAGLASIAGLTTAADRMIYTTASDVYAVATLTAAGRAILDDADATAQRTTLGLGGLATLNILDEDDFASDSATRPPSQQSTKAYVDAAVAAVPSPIKAWVNFNGVPVSGTYSRTGTLVTVTITGHGMSTGMVANLDFTTGTALDGSYTVTVTDANTFTLNTAASGATSGNVTMNLYIRASLNVTSVTDNGTGDYTINFTSAISDANYAVSVTANHPNNTNFSSVAGLYADAGGVVTKTTTALRIGTGASNTTGAQDRSEISVTVVR